MSEEIKALTGLPGVDVYYRIYKRLEDDLMCVVCMQYFDEIDYQERRFVKDKYGNRYYFTCESNGIEAMNAWYPPHRIIEDQRHEPNDLIR